MATPLAASILDAVLGLALGPAGGGADNRLALEGVTSRRGEDGALAIGIRKLEAAALRIASEPFVLEVGQLAVHELAVQVSVEEGQPRVRKVEAAGATLSAVKAYGPVTLGGGTGGATSWSLGPLAGADGSLRAQIRDAHLLFDADVTVAIRQGQVDFDDASVEHVGPDSRMGVSRLGLYVDAPNGRSYLYQFPAAPVAGVEYERRGALLGPWVTHRGNLQLQPFGEALLGQGAGAKGPGLTEQARALFDRTAVSGEVRLGDGRFAAPGVQADLVARAEGRNVVRLRSEALGRGVTVEVGALSVRNALLGAGGFECQCDEATGAVVLQLLVEGTQLRFALELPDLKLSGLRRPPRTGA